MHRDTRRFEFKAMPHGSTEFENVRIDEDRLKNSPRNNQYFSNSEGRELKIWYKNGWRIGCSDDEFIAVEILPSGFLHVTWDEREINIDAIFPDGLKGIDL